MSASIGEHPEIAKKWTWKWSLPGTTVTFASTGLECVGCKISNAEVTGKAGKTATGKGRLSFPGMTVTHPTGCTLRNENASGAKGVLETKPLAIHADWTHEGKAFEQLFPETGETFATFYLEGGECAAVQGSFNLKGTLFGELKNPAGVQAATQEVVFSPAVQAVAGASLSVGGYKSEIKGTGAFSIGGPAFGLK